MGVLGGVTLEVKQEEGVTGTDVTSLGFLNGSEPRSPQSPLHLCSQEKL